MFTLKSLRKDNSDGSNDWLKFQDKYVKLLFDFVFLTW